MAWFLPALELSAPQAANVEVCAAVVVDETCGVNGITARDIVLVCLERALGLIADRDTNAEDPFFIASREVEVVLSVLCCGVRRPELFGDPGNVLYGEGDAVVGDFAGDIGHGEDVVVGHVVLVAIVVVGDIGVDVVGGVDVDAVVEDVGGGVSGVEVSYEGLEVGGGHFGWWSGGLGLEDLGWRGVLCF